MSTRNIFVAIIAVLVLALLVYLLSVMDKGDVPAEKPAVVPEQAAVAPEQATTSTPAAAENEKPVSESDAKLKDLQQKQGALHREGVSSMYLVKCSSCHGRDGRGPVGPAIAGKSKDEIQASLMKYKNKQVPNSAMSGLLEKISDQDIAMLAEEIAKF